MSDFINVCKTAAIPAGEGRAFAVAGRMVAVFFLDGEYFAINDLCPHMGASLAGGYVENHAVSCPWHAWRFSVRDGKWLDNPRVCTDSYEVRVDGDNIQVRLPEPKQPPGTGSVDGCSTGKS